MFRRFDVLSPWNVGNYANVNDQKHAATDYWKDDPQEAKKAGMAYIPVIYPRFAWEQPDGKEGCHGRDSTS